MRKYTRSILIAVAVTVGAAPFLLANAAGTATICWRGRTLVVPSYLVTTYVNSGAQPGACQPSP